MRHTHGVFMRERLRSLSPTGLRGRLLAIVLLAVVPLIVLLSVYAGFENRSGQDRAVADVREELESDVRSMDDLVAASRATLSTFGITHAIQARDWGLTQENTTRLRILHPDYADIVVADATGLVRASSVSVGHPANVAGEQVFKEAVAAKDLVVTGYVTDALTGRPAIQVGLPVYDAEDALICVEYIAFDPAEFRARMSSGGTGSSVEQLVDGAGTLIARQPVIVGTEGKRLGAAALVDAILMSRQGDVTAVGIDGVTRQYFFDPVVSPPQGALYLAVGFSADQFMAAERRTFEATLAGFGLVTVLSLAAAWAIGTASIYRPAKALAEAAERMSDGDLTSRAEGPVRGDEIGTVAREFNAMADSIERQVKELERTRNELRLLNAELEDRVRRRTAELEASNKELEAFSYSVSHDLRSPLRAIDGFSQALLEDYADRLDAEGRDDLNRVRDAATRMGDLIDSLLKLSRLSRQEMRVQKVDLSAVAAETAEAAAHRRPGTRRHVRHRAGRSRLGRSGVAAHTCSTTCWATRGSSRESTRVPASSSASTTVDGQRRVLRPGRRRRIRHGVRGQTVRGVPATARAGRVPGHRDRAGDHGQDRASARRRHMGRGRAGEGSDVLLHAPVPAPNDPA